MEDWLILGHAGQFETAMVMAIRPDLVNEAGLAQTQPVSREGVGLFAPLSGSTIQKHGVWSAGSGSWSQRNRPLHRGKRF